MSDTKQAMYLRLGDKFVVEPSNDPDDNVDVELIGYGYWGLVHNCMIFPCRRLDNGKEVTVESHIHAPVRMLP